jgi:YD repeat-containing protein
VANCNNASTCGCTSPGQIVTAPGVDGGNPASWMFSSAGIRYLDGAVRLNTSDLQSAGFGIPWGQTRSWASDPRYAPVNTTGVGWDVTQQPFLLQSSDRRTLVLVTSGTDTRYFDLNGSTYTPRFFYQEQLRPAAGQFILTDTTGNQLTFFDFSNPPTLQGKLQTIRDPFGNPTNLQWDPQTGHLLQMQRTDVTGAVERYVYSYIPTGPNAGLLQNVQLVLQVTGQPQVVRQVVNTYYNQGDRFGNVGDLKTAFIEDGAQTPHVLDVDYYRYYTPGEQGGQPHQLKYVFNPHSFDRLTAGVGDPFTPLTRRSPPLPTIFTSTIARAGSSRWWPRGPAAPAAQGVRALLRTAIPAVPLATGLTAGKVKPLKRCPTAARTPSSPTPLAR